MFGNYFRASINYLARHKLYTIINVTGLVIGLTCVVMALVFARYETSYDSWVRDADRTYRVESFFHFPGAWESTLYTVGGPVAETMHNRFSQIEDTVRFISFTGATLQIGEDAMSELLTFADPNLVDFFGLQIVRGSRDAALGDPNAIILSRSMATKYFGDEDPIGQVISYRGVKDMRVSAVFADLPPNTHMRMDFITPFDEQLIMREFQSETVFTQWNLVAFSTYIKLVPGADVAQIEAGLEDYTNDHFVHPNPARKGMTPSTFVHYGLRQVEDIHLTSPHPNEMVPTGSQGAVYGGMAIAFLVLGIAVINYISLATATSTLRAREISIRKVMGAARRNIRAQFLSESLITSLFACLFALALIELAMPAINELLGLTAGTLSVTADPLILAAVLLLGPVVGLIAGLYPSFYLSSIRPVKVLGSSRSEGRATSRLRGVLVVAQFAISIGLVVAVIVVTQQSRFVSSMDLGVIRDNVSVVRLPNLEAQRMIPSFLDEVRKLPGVVGATASSQVPTDGSAMSTSVQLSGRENEDALSAWYLSADPGFFETYGVELVAGRLLSEDYANDIMGDIPEESSSFEINMLVNETSLGFIGASSPEDALGRTLRIGGSNMDNQLVNARIVGVVRDFHLGDAYQTIPNTFYISRAEDFFALSIRTRPGVWSEVQGQVEAIWKRHLPGEPIAATNLNEMVDAQYLAIDNQRNFLFVLSGMAVLIACLGLYGMAAFMVARRTKEIGIRKVLGARVWDILVLMLMQFSRPVIVANLIAWPIVYWFMRDWLAGFVYRIDLTIVPFLVAGVAVLMIAWVTVYSHALKVARTNPIKALRYE